MIMSIPKNILVIGAGPVGLATSIGFAHVGYEVKCYDIDKNRIQALKSGQCPFFEEGLQLCLTKYINRIHFMDDPAEAFSNPNIILIAVGTPLGRNNEIDMAAFWNVVNSVSENVQGDAILIIKSTVPVGTNKKVQNLFKSIHINNNIAVVSNPEFLSQGTSIEDTIYPSRIVIGCNSQWAKEQIEDLYAKFDCIKIYTTPESAELIKYEANCYLAMRVSFVNDLAVVCDLVGANVVDVIQGISLDKRIGADYFMPGIGYGGSCLPKDTVAFHGQIQKEYGHELELIEATIDINKRQCLYLCRKILAEHKSIKDKRIAVLGLSFKKGTDDIRNSLAIENIRYLSNHGAHICVWDPVSHIKGDEGFSGEIEIASTIEAAVKDADIILITAEWDEIRNTDLTMFNGKSVYDGKNLFVDKDTHSFSYTYIGGNRIKE